jgi:hypothetical protein
MLARFGSWGVWRCYDDSEARIAVEEKWHILPGEENMLIRGVSSEGLLRWAM